ncbi:MAG TPA: hypothetical protein VG347_07945 [Verrucomicrobiae bacterium]|nr:hypothetical protein [Verrucomicrobiae bacterium]
MNKIQTPESWTKKWLDSVADGSYNMSSRKLTSIEKRGGGLKMAASLAKKRRVHLLLLEDDKGDQLVAASKKPFKIIT